MPSGSNELQRIYMATLHDALRADDKIDTAGRSFPDQCKSIIQGALQAVGPFYGYGILEQSSVPKVELGTREIIKELESIGREIQSFEAVHHYVHINQDMAQKLEVVFRHLPDAVAREGWSAYLIIAVSRACQDLACGPHGRSDSPLNLLYHSVLGNLLRLDSIPASIAYPMLQMATEWGDLEIIALKSDGRDLSTPYWTSTLEIGRQVIQKLSVIFSELGAEGMVSAQYRGNPQEHRISQTSAKRAQQILAESPLVATLLSA